MKLIDEREWKDLYEDCKVLYRDKHDGQNRYDLYNQGFTDALDFVDDWLDAQPNVEMEPVRHGQWVNWGKSGTRYYENYGTCSACHEDAEIGTKHRNYCPNCGARMK